MDVINTLGRRKTSIARIYLKKGKGKVTINGKELKEYFGPEYLQAKVVDPFAVTETDGKFDVDANLSGGGTTGQAEALRLAISNALCEHDSELRPSLKEKGYLTRDPRMVERKKPGQKKARKKFQFSKR